MQTYGYTEYTHISGISEQIAIHYPLFTTDGKSITQKGYIDNMTKRKVKGTFLRCRRFTGQQLGKMSKAPNAITLINGSLVGSSGSRLSLIRKEGNKKIVMEVVLTRSGNYTIYLSEWTLDFRIPGDPMIPKKYTDIWRQVQYIPDQSVSDQVGPLRVEQAEYFESLARRVPLRPVIPRFDRLQYYDPTNPAIGYCTYYPTASETQISETEAIIRGHYESILVTGVLNDADSRAAAQAAYVNAAEGLPSVSSNAMANLLEVASLTAALLRGDVSKASKGIKDAWLAYRYAYTTTCLDVREYSDYIDRIQNLTELAAPDIIKCHGRSTDSRGFRYHCVMKVKTSDALPSDMKSTLSQFGLEMSAVNSWDMVPYSFVVDWFIPVSDILEQFETQFSSKSVPVTECWMSIESPNGEHYLRWPYKWVQTIPQVVQKNVSKKTFWMRVADAIALFT